MPKPHLTLYVDRQFASPFALSAFVALEEKGLPFELRAVNLQAGDHRQAAYTAASITQRVPTLVHDGFALSESSAIAEYLEDVFPGTALYAQIPMARARARQVQAWLRSDFMPIRSERSSYVVFYGPTSVPLSDEARASAERLFAAADTLLERETSHVAGAWSMADVDLAFMLNRLVMNGDAVPPKLAAYARLQWERPSIQRWMCLERPPR